MAYKVLSRVNHDGQILEPGTVVEFEDRVAEELLAVHAIEATDEKPAAPPPPPTPELPTEQPELPAPAEGQVPADNTPAPPVNPAATGGTATETPLAPATAKPTDSSEVLPPAGATPEQIAADVAKIEAGAKK